MAVSREIVDFVISGKDLFSPEAKKLGVTLETVKQVATELGGEMKDLNHALDLTNEFEALAAEGEKAADKTDLLKSQVKELTKELTVASNEVNQTATANKELSSALKESEASLSKTNKSFSKTISDIKKTNEVVSIYADNLNEANAAMDATVAAQSKLNQELGAAKVELAQQRNATQDVINTYKQLADSTDQTQQSLKAVTAQKQEAHAVTKRLRDELTPLANEYKSVSSELAKAEATVNSFTDVQQKLTNTLAKNNAKIAETEVTQKKLAKQYEDTENKLKTLDEQLVIQRKRIADTDAPSAAMTKRLAELESQSGTLTLKLADLGAKIKKAATDMPILQAASQKAADSLRQQSIEFQAAQSAIPGLQSRIQQLTPQYVELTRRVDEAVLAHEDLVKQGRELQASVAKSKVELKAQSEAYNTATKAVKDQENVVSRLQKELNALAVTQSKAAEAQKKATAVLDEQTAKLKELNTVRDELSAKSSELQKKIEAENIALTENKEKLAIVTAEATSLKESKKKLATEAAAAGREVTQLETRLSTLDERMVRAGVDTTNLANEQTRLALAAQQASKNFDKANTSVAALRGNTTKAVDALGIMRTAFYAVVGSEVLQQYVKAIKTFESLELALTSVTGSADKAAKAVNFITSESSRLGLSLEDAASGFAQLSAAGTEAGYTTEQVGFMWQSLSQKAATLGLSSAATGRAITALSQIMSKGKVSSEELRQQLGEALPGSFQIAAKAMGVTTGELMKLLEAGAITQEQFIIPFTKELAKDADMSKNIETMGATLGRFKTEMYEVIKAFDDTSKASSGLKSILGVIPPVTEKLGQGFNTIGRTLGVTAAAASVLIDSFKNSGDAVQSLSLITREYEKDLKAIWGTQDKNKEALKASAQAAEDLRKQQKILADEAKSGAAVFDAQYKVIKKWADEQERLAQATKSTEVPLADQAAKLQEQVNVANEAKEKYALFNDELFAIKASVETRSLPALTQVNMALNAVGLASVNSMEEFAAFIEELRNTGAGAGIAQLELDLFKKSVSAVGTEAEDVGRVKITKLKDGLELLRKDGKLTTEQYANFVSVINESKTPINTVDQLIHALRLELIKSGDSSHEASAKVNELEKNLKELGVAADGTAKTFLQVNAATKGALKDLGLEVTDLTGLVTEENQKITTSYSSLLQTIGLTDANVKLLTETFTKQVTDSRSVAQALKVLDEVLRAGTVSSKAYAEAKRILTDRFNELKPGADTAKQAVIDLNKEFEVGAKTSVKDYSDMMLKLLHLYDSGKISADAYLKKLKELSAAQAQASKNAIKAKDDETNSEKNNKDAKDENTESTNEATEASNTLASASYSLGDSLEAAAKSAGIGSDALAELTGNTKLAAEAQKALSRASDEYIREGQTFAGSVRDWGHAWEGYQAQLDSTIRSYAKLAEREKARNEAAKETSASLGKLKVDLDGVKDATDASGYSNADFKDAISKSALEMSAYGREINNAVGQLARLDKDSQEYKGLSDAIKQAKENYKEYQKDIDDLRKERREKELELIEDIKDAAIDAQKDIADEINDGRSRLKEIEKERYEIAKDNELELLELQMDNADKVYNQELEHLQALHDKATEQDRERLDAFLKQSNAQIDALSGLTSEVVSQEAELLNLLGHKGALAELEYEKEVARIKEAGQVAGDINSDAYKLALSQAQKIHEIKMQKLKDEADAEGKNLETLSELRSKGIVSAENQEIATQKRIDEIKAKQEEARIKQQEREDQRRIELENKEIEFKNKLEKQQIDIDAKKAAFDEAERQKALEGLKAEENEILKQERIYERMNTAINNRLNNELRAANQLASVYSGIATSQSTASARTAQFLKDTKVQIEQVKSLTDNLSIKKFVV